jgi:hypothetical protein
MRKRSVIEIQMDETRIGSENSFSVQRDTLNSENVGSALSYLHVM